MSETLTPRRGLILWCLLGRQGSALQSEVRPAVARLDREALIERGLVAAEKQGRSLRLTVTERGWRWASDHLHAPLPETFRALQDWLGLIARHLDATGATLADLVGEAPAPTREALPARQARILRALIDAQGSASPRDLKPAAARADREALVAAGLVAQEPRGRSVQLTITEAGRHWARTHLGLALPGGQEAAPAPAPLERIEAAYLALTDGRRREAVRLSRIRAELADLDRASVDAGLALILREGRKARLMQITDPRGLDAAERAAAFSPAGEPFHLLWIEP
ncbi:hypothetical protein [Methylobacterium sp. WSM2598]|uniref:hypothetical protein n=1 Tax=Methylobacterium sp. WSM2598 TaxID=398261 RepID=UPI000381018D|nr:hypothetical protein [Methylobacterium sp. WSM2598]